MLNSLSHTQVWVFDQDEALDFYVNKLGLEVHTDAPMANMRWLTVNVPGRPDTEIMLLQPFAPIVDDATAAQLRELVAKGAGATLIFKTDDCQGTYEALRDRGVDFTQFPEKQFYGTDCALRDPFGNYIRISQPVDGPVEVPEELRAGAS